MEILHVTLFITLIHSLSYVCLLVLFTLMTFFSFTMKVEFNNSTLVKLPPFSCAFYHTFEHLTRLNERVIERVNDTRRCSSNEFIDD